MQCNTNYTASGKNHHYLNLNVLNQYRSIFKEKVILGLSDHTEGHNSVLEQSQLERGWLRSILQMITIGLVQIINFQ